MDPPSLFPEIDTPALLIDLDALERNLDRLAAFSAAAGCALRPHFKAHRLAEICRLQRERGAIGITCAKLAEAEALAGQGFGGLLIANQVVGPHKWARLARLAERCEVMVAVDDLEVARHTAAAARERGATVGVLVEVNLGMDRCGVPPGQAAVELARRCADLPGLAFRGLMGYEGHVVPLPRAEKEAACRADIALLTGTAERCRAEGLAVETVSAGGTGSWDVTGRCPGVTELQCGTYALMDILFREVGGAPFDYACTVLSTVISRPAPDRAITDAGKKSLHPSFGMARPVDLPGAELAVLFSEHGLLRLAEPAPDLQPGDRVRFLPYYLEGTVNLFETAYAVRGAEVVAEWPITGKGCSR
jgi:D-serine deaminase-like pyridoxal phosphate-dependent protein